MATRENQGLKFAVIIFATLTVALIATSFIAFKNFQEEQQKNKTLTAEKEKAVTETQKKDADKTQLMIAIGAKPTDDIKTILDAYAGDKKTFGTGLPEAKLQYRPMLESLFTQIRDLNGRQVDGRDREAKLEAQIKTDEAAHAKENTEKDKAIETVTQDEKAEKDKNVVEREIQRKGYDDIASKLEAKRKEFDDRIKKTNDTIALLSNEIIKLTSINSELTGKIRKEDLASEVSDGKITWVNQRAKTVWINLGSDDGLRRQTSFTVLGPEENNPIKAEKKGAIEVTRILDHHLSEARILDDTLSNPILPGDQVFSLVWHPGQIERFALAGFMDIEGTGESSRKLVEKLIALNGGKVDAQVTDDGKRVGSMTTDTRYLILGARPSDTGQHASPEFLKNYSKMIEEAQKLGVKTMSLQEFLDHIGYVGGEKTIPLGAKSQSSDFKATYPEGVAPKATNPLFQFKPRTPPGPDAAGPKSSAYDK